VPAPTHSWWTALARTSVLHRDLSVRQTPVAIYLPSRHSAPRKAWLRLTLYRSSRSRHPVILLSLVGSQAARFRSLPDLEPTTFTDRRLIICEMTNSMLTIGLRTGPDNLDHRSDRMTLEGH